MLDFLFPADQDAEDISWSDENIRVGVTWAAWQFALKSGMYEDLKAVCGEKDARYLLALAVYKLDGQGAMMNFEDWVPQVWLPNIRPIDGRRISELLKTVDLTKTENYYKRRYDRALCQSKEPLTLSFDSTGISTYSTTIKEAAWGHAKQDPHLRQVNYIAVCDHATGDVVYACTYDGSVNDKTILPTIYLQVQSAGLDSLAWLNAFLRHSRRLKVKTPYCS